MEYYLAESCKNTFVLFDALFEEGLSDSYLKRAHSILLDEGRDDALILKNGRSTKRSLHVEMVVLGVDGKLGEFCGNGARACAAFLFENYPMFKDYFLVTKWGAHPVFQWGNGVYSVKFPKPKLKINQKFIKTEDLGNFHYVEAIEPHLIYEKEMSDEELMLLGQKLNSEKTLYPHGININAYHVLSDGSLEVKTYERGVQRLTKSCGSGSTSCAYFHRPEGKTTVLNSGGVIHVICSRGEVELVGPSFVEKEQKYGCNSKKICYSNHQEIL